MKSENLELLGLLSGMIVDLPARSSFFNTFYWIVDYECKHYPRPITRSSETKDSSGKVFNTLKERLLRFDRCSQILILNKSISNTIPPILYTPNILQNTFPYPMLIEVIPQCSPYPTISHFLYPADHLMPIHITTIPTDEPTPIFYSKNQAQPKNAAQE